MPTPFHPWSSFIPRLNGLGMKLPLEECVPPEQITLEVKIEADIVVKLPCGCGQVNHVSHECMAHFDL